MNYAVEMGLSAMIYVARFIQSGSGIQKLMRGHTYTHTQEGDLISLLLFFSKEGKYAYKNDSP
jgi:hypothetical protein